MIDLLRAQYFGDFRESNLSGLGTSAIAKKLGIDRSYV